jgi:hypothetical protein
MRKVKILIALLLLPTLNGSCIFQSDPLAPNNPPELQYYEPQETYINDFIATNSLTFRIYATDPDSDDIEYSFTIDDIETSQADTMFFHPFEEGLYVIVGSARDAKSSVSHQWKVNVLAQPNEPPVITECEPAQQSIACVVGDELHFSFTVLDENPESLEYSYELNDEVVAQHLTTSSFDFRFLENGQQVLDGIVYDGEFRDTATWYVSVEGFPDTICPSAITDLAGAPGETWGSIHLTWTAPGDDSTWGAASSYHVRTSVYPIITESDWLNAEGKSGEPVPSVFGTPEEMTVTRLNPGTYLWVTIRAQDDFFNWSPLGNCILVLVRGADFEGFVLDARSAEPIGGHTVSGSGRSSISDQDGHYLIENIPSYATTLRCQDELIGGEIGAYYDCTQPITISGLYNQLDFYSVPALELVNTVTDVYMNRFYLFFINITNTTLNPALKTWHRYPLRVHNPPIVFKDVDLQAAAQVAMNEWESMTGYDLFEIVGDPDSADVCICYNDSVVAFHTTKTIETNPDGTPKLKYLCISLLNTIIPINLKAHLIFAHELGHILCLGHSKDAGHLMLGASLPDEEHVTTDEANAVMIIYNLPAIYNVSYTIEE